MIKNVLITGWAVAGFASLALADVPGQELNK